MQIKFEGLDELKRQLKDFSERRLNAAVATALTRTAVKVRAKIQADMPSIFNNPTPYTVRQLRYVAARADRLVAAVGFNVVAIEDAEGNVMRYQDLGKGQTPAGKYLTPQIEGGRRNHKRMEKALHAVGVLPPGWYVVPGRFAKLDSYGNQSVGELRQILSWFDAAEMTAGSRQNMGPAGRAKRRKGTKKTAGFEYFAIRPGAPGGLRPGIYRRTAGSRAVLMVLAFVTSVSYRRRFDFYGIAQAEANRIMPQEVVKAIREFRERM